MNKLRLTRLRPHLATPKATFEEDSFRDTKGDLVMTQKRLRKSPRSKTPDRHRVLVYIKNGYEYTYHATKGWRRSKL